MRTFFILAGLMIAIFGRLAAQRACSTAQYHQDQINNNFSYAQEISRIEFFIQQQLAHISSTNGSARLQGAVIEIPVVVHVLYHQPQENISDERIFSQIATLNKCFRRRNADTAKTPVVFKQLAADCEIEFKLATSDPLKRSTNGIIHKYTPITSWQPDDAMKSSSQMGDDPWDARNYLNIWVCNMRKVAGYASVPGGPPEQDGIVIDYSDFGPNGNAGYEMGKTAVHEAGHWLGLKHLWGDDYCGDDLVADTPKQGGYNVGCPSGTRISCGNGPAGDMYVNYMDYTNDACTNMFTTGQKARMRSFFVPGGPRYSLLSSFGLDAPLINEIPLPEEAPRWLHPQVYPNPATNELIIDIAFDIRWIGKTLTIFSMNGQKVMEVVIMAKTQTIDIGMLKRGMYFISAKKEDGSYIKQKFVKM